MKNEPIKALILLCITFLAITSCEQQNGKSVTDAISDNKITQANIPANYISQIVHPGILNSDASLDFIDADYNNNNSYRQQAYGTINTMINSQISFPTSFPDKVFLRIGGDTIPDSELQMWNDGLLAYGHALRWARTGSSTDASKAKTILNGWASAFDEGDIVMCKANDPPSAAAGCPTDPTKYPMSGVKRHLQASWVAPNFAAAAEIIRRYDVHGGAGWSSSKANDFEIFLERLYDPYVETIAGGIQITSSSDTTGWANNNWGASAVWAQMAISVYQGNTSRFNDALTKAGYLIQNIINSSSGQVLEYWRDCLHPQMSLTALTYAAETAKIQGDHSLYGNFSGSTLEKGWEWMSDAFGTNDCNYRPTKDKIMPGVDVAYNYYESNDIEDLRDEEEPYGVVTRQFIGFTTYTHYDVDVQTGQPATAVTTALHKPTSNTQVSVGYEGESIAVNYNSGESLDNMLTKMKDAINSDQDIEITAEVNLSNNTITFIEKTPGSFANSNSVVLLFFTGDWQNGAGFSPSPTSMSGGTDS